MGGYGSVLRARVGYSTLRPVAASGLWAGERCRGRFGLWWAGTSGGIGRCGPLGQKLTLVACGTMCERFADVLRRAPA